MLAALCPFVDPIYLSELESLIVSRFPDRIEDKSQQIAYHMRVVPKIEMLYTASDLVMLEDEDYMRKMNEIRGGESALVDESLANRQAEFERLLSSDTYSDNNNNGIMCHGCNGRRIGFESRQTRAADEGPTVFCVCLNPKCNRRWRM